MAERGRKARSLPRAHRRPGGARGGRADPAGGPPLASGALRPRRYASRSGSPGQPTRAHARAYERYVEEHARRLGDVGTAEAALFLLVSLREPERDVASYVSRAAAAASAAMVERAQARRSQRDRRLLSAVRARAGAGARRSGARPPGGLPAGASGPRRGAAVAGAQGVLPRAGRAGRRRPARAAGARVRAQRGGGAGAAGGRRDALGGRLRRAPRPGAARSSPSSARAGRRSWCSARCPSARSSRAHARS